MKDEKKRVEKETVGQGRVLGPDIQKGKDATTRSLLVNRPAREVRSPLLLGRVGVRVEPVDGATDTSQCEDDLYSVSPETLLLGEHFHPRRSR